MSHFKCETLPPEDLIPRVAVLKKSGHRLVQISCSEGEEYELIYSFDKDYDLVNLKIVLPAENLCVKSISGIYWGAFVYENEIHDLFGIKVEGIAVDYKGSFYRTKVKWPFAKAQPKGETDG